METRIIQFLKLLLISVLVGFAFFCAASRATSNWDESNIFALISDSDIFTHSFHITPWLFRLSLIMVAILIGLSAPESFSGYLRRLGNSLMLAGASWQHYVCSALVGGLCGIMTFAITFKTLDTWYLFEGDALMLFLICLSYGIFLHPAKPTTSSGPTLPEDIIGVSTTVEYITRGIGIAFEGPQGTLSNTLPKTLAVAGERGSGKSFILQKVQHKLVTELNLECEIFKPWNFDSHALFYEEVMGYLFRVLEKKYVIPKPRALVTSYIGSFCDEPKKVLNTVFGQFFGDLSSEKRTLQDAEMWIKNGGNIVLIFDDLDRCHQSELRQVFRLMDRLSTFPNIFLIASIDNKTMDRIAEFENRAEIPVKVTS